MVLPGERFVPSNPPTGHRGDVGPVRAAVAKVVALVAVYGGLVILGIVPLVGFAFAGFLGSVAGGFVTAYALFTLRASDYTLYTLRLAVIDAVRTGEWRPG
jgi:hypothetical protein